MTRTLQVRKERFGSQNEVTLNWFVFRSHLVHVYSLFIATKVILFR